MQLWFSSDPHFWHENIIKFCNRPFASASEMNECIVDKHNSLVKPEDHWYCLGDVTMLRHASDKWKVVKLIKSMNGHKRLIMGNHDHFSTQDYRDMGFEKIMAHQMHEQLRLTHFPVHPSSMGSAKANVHGHTHDAPNFPPVVYEKDYDGKKVERVVRPYINISLDVTNFEPVNLDDIKQMIENAKDSYDPIHPRS